MEHRSAASILKAVSIIGLLLPGIGTALADNSGPTEREAHATALFDSLAGQSSRLRIFLQGMPKGGDLHNHLVGTVYAEDFLR